MRLQSAAIRENSGTVFPKRPATSTTMKLAICFLAVLGCALSMPAEPEIDWEKITPIDVHVEPINPVDSEELPGGRIIGGNEVSPNSVPYQAALLINGAGFCGGSLISANRVLTAAHCTASASFVQVILGAHAFNSNEATQVRVTSTSVRNHASYNPSTISNDVAVILLPSSVTLNNNIRTIPLAPASAGTFEGSRAFLTGWGRTSDSSNAVSPVLRGVNLNIIGNTACRNVFGSVVVASTICTSGAGIVGGCNGDSGGPLVVDGVQVGIVSFGSARCQAGNPTAFARVSSFRSWISQNAGV